MITKIPLDAIHVDPATTQRGYVLYDRVQNKLVVGDERDTTNAIKRTGDTLSQKISYDTTIVEITDQDQLVHSAYVDYQIEVLQQSWDDYLGTEGGQMSGPILVASTSDDSAAIATKGQVDDRLGDNNFIAKEGGTMKDALHLHSTDSADYGEFQAVPKTYVDQAVEAAKSVFTTYFDESYLAVTGGTMTGPMYQEAPSQPYDDNHVLTMGFSKQFVQDFVNNTDWSCSGVVGTTLTGCDSSSSL